MKGPKQFQTGVRGLLYLTLEELWWDSVGNLSGSYTTAYVDPVHNMTVCRVQGLSELLASEAATMGREGTPGIDLPLRGFEGLRV